MTWLQMADDVSQNLAVLYTAPQHFVVQCQNEWRVYVTKHFYWRIAANRLLDIYKVIHLPPMDSPTQNPVMPTFGDFV